MPQQKNWDKRSERRWVNIRGSKSDMSVLRVVDRRNRTNVDHNWAVVLDRKGSGGKQTLKTFDKVKPAERWASRWRERNPEG